MGELAGEMEGTEVAPFFILFCWQILLLVTKIHLWRPQKVPAQSTSAVARGSSKTPC